MSKKYMKKSQTLMLATASLLMLANAPLRASDTDDRIVSSAKSSYVFKTYLKDDSIKTKSKDGAVTLSGSVVDASHKTLAENTVESLPGVVSVNNRIKVKGEKQPAEH